jgi:hypothetical protein
MSRVNERAGALAFDAPKDGSPSDVMCPQPVDDRFIKRLSVPFVVLADVDPPSSWLCPHALRGALRDLPFFFLLSGFHDRSVVHFDQTAAHHFVEFRQQFLLKRSG